MLRFVQTRQGKQGALKMRRKNNPFILSSLEEEMAGPVVTVPRQCFQATADFVQPGTVAIVFKTTDAIW